MNAAIIAALMAMLAGPGGWREEQRNLLGGWMRHSLACQNLEMFARYDDPHRTCLLKSDERTVMVLEPVHQPEQFILATLHDAEAAQVWNQAVLRVTEQLHMDRAQDGRHTQEHRDDWLRRHAPP